MILLIRLTFYYLINFNTAQLSGYSIIHDVCFAYEYLYIQRVNSKGRLIFCCLSACRLIRIAHTHTQPEFMHNNTPRLDAIIVECDVILENIRNYHKNTNHSWRWKRETKTIKKRRNWNLFLWWNHTVAVALFHVNRALNVTIPFYLISCFYYDFEILQHREVEAVGKKDEKKNGQNSLFTQRTRSTAYEVCHAYSTHMT